jgi:hypothetical protein
MKEFIETIQRQLDDNRKKNKTPILDSNPQGIMVIPELEKVLAALEFLVKAKSKLKTGHLLHFNIAGRRSIHIPLSMGTLIINHESRRSYPYVMTIEGLNTDYLTSDALLKTIAQILGNELKTLGQIDSKIYSPKVRDVLEI